MSAFEPKQTSGVLLNQNLPTLLNAVKLEGLRNRVEVTTDPYSPPFGPVTSTAAPALTAGISLPSAAGRLAPRVSDEEGEHEPNDRSPAGRRDDY
jgi:hypothetical protein